MHPVVKSLLVLGAVAGANSALAAPAVDVGRLEDVSPGKKISVTLALPLRNPELIESAIHDMYTQGGDQYHKFLTAAEFAQRFGPTPETLQRVVAELQHEGLSVTRTGATLLKASGDSATVQKAFGAELHVFEVAASGGKAGYRYFAPAVKKSPTLNLAEYVGIVGLDNKPRFHTHTRRAAAQSQVQGKVTVKPAVQTTDVPGEWTVQDFEQYYNATPLYSEGVNGKGRTIGIVTLASFTPSDAFYYWQGLGLNVNPGRLTEVLIDLGPGAPSDQGGSLETTIDVEQSGGIAPAANMIVYEAPNTTQGFIDAFGAAIESNTADAISTSWGNWEAFDEGTDANFPGLAVTGTVVQIYDGLFFQAALQGQSMSAAAGDNGAYDESDFFPVPLYSKVLSVDSPASQRWITAAGATTIAAQFIFTLDAGGTVQVDVPKERVWGWDWLEPVCVAVGYPDPVACGIFSAGGGGGVSSYNPLPFYQVGIANIDKTPTYQSLIQYQPPPTTDLLDLPGNYRGRNVPDIAANGDPYTGYIVVYTSSVNGFGVQSGWGGTSFVAPQLAGVTALLDQKVHGRVGLLTIPLYELVRTGFGYQNTLLGGAALRDIATGDNWYWHGLPGYDRGTGVGVPNIANLAKILAEIQ